MQEFDAWRLQNPLSCKCRKDSRYWYTLVQHHANVSLDESVEFMPDFRRENIHGLDRHRGPRTDEICLRERSVGVYAAIGKVFYDAFRPSWHMNKTDDESNANVVKGSALLLGAAQGPVGHGHGGAVVHVLEDISALACPMLDLDRSTTAFHTASLEVRFRGKVPLLTTLAVEARVTKRSADGIVVEGKVRALWVVML